MKRLLVLGVLTGFALIPLTIWMQIQGRERGREHFEAFYSSAIDSEVKSVRGAYKGSELTLADNRKFVFYPYTDEKLNGGNIFNYTAEKGDGVFKQAYGDTLYLEKDGKTLIYTYSKF